MKKKLLLIRPRDERLSRITAYEPIGLGIIAALTPDDWDVEIIDENFTPFQYKEADMVGISVTTPSAVRSYNIASQYLKNNIKVVLGGIHVTICPDEAKQFASSVVLGYAETVWKELIHDFNHNTLKPLYHVVPDDNFKFVSPKRECYPKHYLIATVEASRGCLYHCSFCYAPEFHYRKFYYKPNEQIVYELNQIRQKFFIFCDDNFYGFKDSYRKKLTELFSEIVEQKINKYWMCCASVSMGGDTLFLKSAAKSGCKTIYFGIETVNGNNLKTINKPSNLILLRNQNKNFFKPVHQNKIAVFGGLVCGYENDDENFISDTVNYILRENIDAYTFTILTPFPGTDMFNQLKKGDFLIYKDYPHSWRHYSLSELVFIHKNFETGSFQKVFEKANDKIYSKKNIIYKFIKSIINTKSIKSGLINLIFILNHHTSDRIRFKNNFSIQFFYNLALFIYNRNYTK